MSARHYDHAPIIEAVVEFRFENEVEEDVLAAIAQKLRTHFPTQLVQKMREIHVEIPVDLPDDQTPSVGTSAKPQRRLSDTSESRVAILRPNSITVSKFPPYLSFEDLRSDCEVVWDAAYKVTKYRKLSQIGMRYINRIDLPFDGDVINHEEYINIYVKIPDKYQRITRHSLTFEMPIPDLNLIAKVRSFVGQPALIDHASFFLDIDIIRRSELPQKKTELFLLIDELRTVKNDMFESFITDKTRQIFDAI